jgi:hypothetical protein
MSNRLEEIINDVEKKEAIAAKVPEENPTTYRVVKGKIDRAKEDLKQLFLDYRDEVRHRSAFIIVTGNSVDKFSSIAQEEFGCFVQNADEFYHDITSKVDKRLYTNYTASPNVFDIVAAGFEERALEVGIVGYMGLLFESKYKKVLNGKDDLVNLIKRAFNEKVGAEAVAFDAIDKVAKNGLKDKFTGKNVPIVLFTEDEKLALELKKDLPRVSNNVFLIAAGKNELDVTPFAKLGRITNKNVEETLVNIRGNLK